MVWSPPFRRNLSDDNINCAHKFRIPRIPGREREQGRDGTMNETAIDINLSANKNMQCPYNWPIAIIIVVAGRDDVMTVFGGADVANWVWV